MKNAKTLADHGIPLSRLALVDALLEENTKKLLFLLEKELLELKSPFFMDFMNALRPSLQIEVLRLFLSTLERYSAKSVLRRNHLTDRALITPSSGIEDETVAKLFETASAALDALEHNPSSAQNIVYFLGSFVSFHEEHRKLAQLGFDYCKATYGPSIILAWSQLVHSARGISFTNSYFERMNAIRLASNESCPFVKAVTFPGSNIDSFSALLAIKLAKLNDDLLLWLWGSDNLINFANKPDGGSHWPIFKYEKTEILVSARPNSMLATEDAFQLAIFETQKRFGTKITRLPDRYRSDCIDLSSTWLTKQQQNNDTDN